MDSYCSVLKVHILSSVADGSSHQVLFAHSFGGSVILNSFNLSRFESGVHVSLTLFNTRDELDVYLAAATNVSYGHLVDLNASLATLYNHVASDIRVTLLT